jgi:beta-lactamase superfamily II metal-dependent hydrolase
MGFQTEKYEIDILNVKNADAILIRLFHLENDYIILIDAGNISDSLTIKNHLINAYDNLTIDLAICTHPDIDHIGGFFGLLDDDEIKIKEFWLTDPADYLNEEDILHYKNRDNAINAVRKLFNKPGDPSKNLINLLKEAKVNINSVKQDDYHIDIPIKVLAPCPNYYSELIKIMVQDFSIKTYDDPDTESYDENALPNEEQSVIDIDDDKSPYNASSIVLLFEPTSNRKYLFAGDANCASLKNMIDKYDSHVKDVNILKVPHHGSKHNLTTEIINHLSPKISIISSQGSKKHPNSGIVHWLSKHGHVYSTHKSSGGLHYFKNIESRKGNKSAIPLRKKQ